MEFLNQIFDFIDHAMDKFTNEVSEGLDQLTNEVTNTVDSIGAGIEGLFKPSGQTWAFNKPQAIDFNALGGNFHKKT